MYTVTIYTGTNFNPVNIPYNPSVITSSASNIYELPAIDVVQNYVLSSVTVSGSAVTGNFWDTIKLADYCKVGDFYYFVTSIKMTSPDVAVLELLPDYFTSARALGSIKSLGGTTIRRRVSESEDVFGRYTTDDPLLAPQEPLVLTVQDMMFGSDAVSVDDHSDLYVESLVDLEKLASQFSIGLSEDGSSVTGIQFNGTGTSFVDPTNEDRVVTVPYIAPVTTSTKFLSLGKELPDRGTGIYFLDSSGVRYATNLIHALGIESGIIKQYNVPELYANVTYDATDLSKMITQIRSTSNIRLSDLPFEYASVKNKRLLYGTYNSYGLLTTSGSSLIMKPEEITGYTGSVPRVRFISDPRPDGKPYFRFEYYNSDNSDEGFWLNAIAGSSWTEQPLKFDGMSGVYKNYISLASTLGTQEVIHNFDKSDILRRTVTDAVKQIGNALLGTTSSYNRYTEHSDEYQMTHKFIPSQLVSSIMNAEINMASATGDIISSQYRYEASKANELQQFAISNAVSVPTISFVPDNNIIRDIYGNGVIPFRYHYSQNDLKRIDMLLTMYGYAEQEPFFMSMLDDHTDFEYIQLQGVQVYGDNLPTWWREGIQAQLTTGTRIWHVKPDNRYYESGLSYEITDKTTTTEETTNATDN